MKSIWLCELPMKKGQWDNHYRFYDDGTIEHEYDLSVKKYNLSTKIQPSEIEDRDRVAILAKIEDCQKEWQAFIMDLLKQ